MRAKFFSCFSCTAVTFASSPSARFRSRLCRRPPRPCPRRSLSGERRADRPVFLIGSASAAYRVDPCAPGVVGVALGPVAHDYRAIPVAVLTAVLPDPAVRILLLTRWSLGGLEPLTPCLQTTGSTSARVHPRRRAPESMQSRPVAVLPCCTWAQDQGTVPRGTTQATGWPVTCAMSS
jgi:hypothetical protein